MRFGHDIAVALESGVWLANTLNDANALRSVADLHAFYRDFDYTGAEPTPADLAPMRAIRRQLRELFLAGRDDAAGLVNEILAQSHAVPRLVRHGTTDWHIHATADSDPLPTRVLVESAIGVIDMIRANEMDRFGVCALDDCDGVLLDLSRNRSRLYCCVACTNRAAAAAYRARARS